MLPACHRLRERRAFGRLYQMGKRRSGRMISLIWLAGKSGESASPEPTRLAVVVSKKVSKRAVVRNRIRRRLRHALRIVCPHLRPGFWVLLTARTAILEASWPQIQTEVEQVLRQACLLSESCQG
ncbi:MAG: ribonuclease P protein component [Synechococcaceae cyanobacterium SM2_3_1]|nr:ribonuclease P protein component [Synechococcaceae cyanobacterium SM2_3_1]